jgi:hypothetical protein
VSPSVAAAGKFMDLFTRNMAAMSPDQKIAAERLLAAYSK